MDPAHAWSGELVEHRGQHYTIDGVQFLPRPAHHPDQLAEIVATLTDLRPATAGAYDIAVGLPVGVDPGPYVEAGATWWMPEFAPGDVTLDQVRGVLRQGPLTR